MKIDCIADLHGHFPILDGGDLLIIAGDLTAHDIEDEYYEFNGWLCEQEYDQKIIIAGNHDTLLQKDGWLCKQEYDQKIIIAGNHDTLLQKEGIIYLEGSPAFEYLQDSGCELSGLKIWGMPWTPTFKGINPKCTAFTYDPKDHDFINEKLSLIPQDVDILITHGPCQQYLDRTIKNKHVGSTHLWAHLKYNFRPKLHVFGHIHEAYGQGEFFTDCWSVNCSLVNENYKPVNKPITVKL